MVIRAFIVDKSFVSRRVLERILLEYNEDGDFIEMAGEAGSVSEAIYLMGDAEPDLLFINAEPEEMTFIGSDIDDVKKLRPDIKIIFCASAKSPQSAENAWKGGAHNFLVKPFKPSKVFSTINVLTRK